MFGTIDVAASSLTANSGDGGAGCADLRPGDRCTRRQFHLEQGRIIGRALRGLPQSADPRLRALAAIGDDEERAELYFVQKLWSVMQDAGIDPELAAGRPRYRGCSELALIISQGEVVPAGIGIDVGGFEVMSGALRIADPCYLQESGPEIDKLFGATLPAVAGTWRSMSFLSDGCDHAGGPEVSQLRLWADGRSGVFGDVPDDEFMVMVDSGLAGCFDRGEAERISSLGPEAVGALADSLKVAGPAQAIVVNGAGGVVASGRDGRYRGGAWRDAEGVVIALSIRFDD